MPPEWGGGQIEKIWENTTYPTAQGTITVSEDISTYDGIFIDVIWGDGDPITVTNYHQLEYFPKERYTYGYNRIYIYNSYRDVAISTNNIVFSGSGGSSTTNRVVPIAVYGVKGLTFN